MVINMIVIMMIMILLLPLLLLQLLLLLITIIKDAWTNFDSQICCTLFAENDSKQKTNGHKGEMYGKTSEFIWRTFKLIKCFLNSD